MGPIVNKFIQRDVKKLRRQIGDEAIVQYDRQIFQDQIRGIINMYTDKIPYINREQQYLGHTNWYLQQIENSAQKKYEDLLKEKSRNKTDQGTSTDIDKGLDDSDLSSIYNQLRRENIGNYDRVIGDFYNENDQDNPWFQRTQLQEPEEQKQEQEQHIPKIMTRKPKEISNINFYRDVQFQRPAPKSKQYELTNESKKQLTKLTPEQKNDILENLKTVKQSTSVKKIITYLDDIELRVPMSHAITQQIAMKQIE